MIINVKFEACSSYRSSSAVKQQQNRPCNKAPFFDEIKEKPNRITNKEILSVENVHLSTLLSKAIFKLLVPTKQWP